jgi:DNA-binding Lrp family transcriptional regulator
LKIMKCLVTDPRGYRDFVSSKTVARRLEKLKEKHILDFSILTNLSSMQLIGYIEFAILINIDVSHYRNIVERIYGDLHEYLLFIPNGYEKEVIFAVFFSANVPKVNSVLRSLESYDGGIYNN